MSTEAAEVKELRHVIYGLDRAATEQVDQVLLDARVFDAMARQLRSPDDTTQSRRGLADQGRWLWRPAFPRPPEGRPYL